MSLPTPRITVETLQKSLHAKAKAEPSFRFYSLWDKVYRRDVLSEAYRRCRANGGAAGVDRVTFKDIDAQGVAQWLGNLEEELQTKEYQTQPLLRVWIPKSNGKKRPLGIPTIRDRVAQMAVQLVLGPIFEADLFPQQYGFRPGLDAKMAIRRVYFNIAEHGRGEVVDGDLSDYFNTIPHGSLMKCVSRRIADGQVLAVIKQWLTAAVVERTKQGEKRNTEAKDGKRGTPQGGVISPLLANLYFRRFLLVWYGRGIADRLNAQVINYADDLVICCKPGSGPVAMRTMREVMQRLGLTVNEEKTRLAKLPEDTFDFLGYTFGRFHGKDGKAYLGTRPSKKSVAKVMGKIHDETSTQWLTSTAEKRVEELNRIIRGWCGYFNQGPVIGIYRNIREYTERRLRRWLMKKHKRRGTGYRQYPDQYLYETLALFKPPGRRLDLPKVKA